MTARYQFHFYKERLGPNTESKPLAVTNRIIYVVSGVLAVGDKLLKAGDATFERGSVILKTQSDNVELWRWDLVAINATEVSSSPERHQITPTLSAPIENLEINPGSEWILRCQTVDFPPETTVEMHAHDGAGIRCLEFGEINFTHLDGMKNTVLPGDAWYEEAFHYLHALTMKSGPSRFVRVMLVPLEYRDTSTFKYHNHDDAEETRRQTTAKLSDGAVTL
ncbi:MAG: hypothetical protein GKS01_19455 [Alphaproteobacteria bacterium]|nr:hypothetical protein [Alphaproteobacteria bacterium]